MARGGSSLKLGDYIYNRRQPGKNNQWRWYCSRYHKGCKVVVITNKNFVVTEYLGEHSHDPPQLYPTGRGYVFI